MFVMKRKSMREFGIKLNRYANWRVALVGEIVIRLPLLSCSKVMLSYPERANQPLPCSHFHSSENALAKP